MLRVNEHLHKVSRQSENTHLPLKSLGYVPAFLPYKSAKRDYLNTLISLYTNWFEPRTDNWLYLSGDAVPVCVF